MKGGYLNKFLGIYDCDEGEVSDSARKFWLRVMNECVRRRYLKSKGIEESVCLDTDDFNQFKSCKQHEKSAMENYMAEMDFYLKKYETCTAEGIRAQYPLSNIEEVCGNMMIKFIRANDQIL